MTEEITPELEAKIAEAIMQNKPYLIEIEDHVSAVGYGDIDLKLTIRAGTVEKISFIESKTWLKDKRT